MQNILLLLFLLNCFSLFGQETATGVFYPATVTVNGSPVAIDTITAPVALNGRTRIVIFDNGKNKVSVVCKLKTKENFKKHKERADIYKNGRWRKAKIRFMHDGWYFRITRWKGRGKASGFLANGNTKSGIQVNSSYKGTGNEKIVVSGFFELSH